MIVRDSHLRGVTFSTVRSRSGSKLICSHAGFKWAYMHIIHSNPLKFLSAIRVLRLDLSESICI